MTKLEVIIRPAKFEAVKDVLGDLGVQGMTIADVRKAIRKPIAAMNTLWVLCRKSRSTSCFPITLWTTS